MEALAVIVLLALGSFALGALLVASARARRRAVLASPAPGVIDVLRRARSLDDPRARAELLARERPSTWEGRLAEALLEARTELERVDVASEASGDLGADWGSRARWAAASVRLAAAGSLLGGVVGWLGADWPGALAGGLPVLLLGGVAFAVHEVASGAEPDQRRRADEVVQALVPEAAGHESARPRRARSDW